MNKNTRIARELLAVARRLVASDGNEEVGEWAKAFSSKYIKRQPSISGCALTLNLYDIGGSCYWRKMDDPISRSVKFPTVDMPLDQYRQELSKAFKKLSEDIFAFFMRYSDYYKIKSQVEAASKWLENLSNLALSANIDFKVGDSLEGLRCVDDEYKQHEKANDLKQWLSGYNWNVFIPSGSERKYGRVWVDWEKKVYRYNCTMDEFYGNGTVD